MIQARGKGSWARWAWFLGLASLCLVAAWARADSRSEDVTAAGMGSLLTNFSNWVAQGMLWGFSSLVLVLWLVLSWAVVKLYMAIGDYILPLWDFTSAHGATLFQQALPDYMCVNPRTAEIMQVMGWFFFAVSSLLTFVVASGDMLKASLADEDGQRVLAGFFYAFGVMLIYPWLYTGVILLANDLTVLTHNLVNAYFQPNATTITTALLQTSVFGSMDSATQAQIGVGSLPVQTTTGLTYLNPQYVVNPTTLFSQAFSSKGNVWNLAATFVNSSPEMFISRLIQIVLCVMGLFELLMLLMLKGAQVAGVLINYFLGILAIAMLASPRTRPIFFQWFRHFIELCLWGFIWALLLLATWVILSAVADLRGFSGVLIGTFLFPFLLFGTLKKFVEVAGIISGFAVTGALATAVGRAVGSGFNQHREAGLVGAGAAMKVGTAWGSQAVGLVADKASHLALAVPGVGVPAAMGIQAAGKAGSALVKATGKAGQLAATGLQQPKGQNVADGIRTASRWAAGGASAVANPGAAAAAGLTKLAGVHQDIAGKVAEQQAARSAAAPSAGTKSGSKS
jgi:hypothetical protein